MNAEKNSENNSKSEYEEIEYEGFENNNEGENNNGETAEEVEAKLKELSEKAANNAPHCKNNVIEIKKIGKAQMVIIVGLQHDPDRKELDWIRDIRNLLNKQVPFTKVHIFVSFHDGKDGLKSLKDYLDERKSELGEFLDIHYENETSWSFGDIEKVIVESSDSTYLVLLGHGFPKTINGTEKTILSMGFTSDRKPQNISGEEIKNIVSKDKHIVVFSVMCYASKFLPKSDIIPNLHYIFLGESGVCKENYYTLNIDKMISAFFSIEGFKTLQHGLYDYNKIANPYEKIDIHSCNSFVRFSSPFEGGGTVECPFQGHSPAVPKVPSLRYSTINAGRAGVSNRVSLDMALDGRNQKRKQTKRIKKKTRKMKRRSLKRRS